MVIDKARLERQYEGVDKWFAAGCIGAFNYYTGVGKTFTAILALKRLFKLYPHHTVAIIVPVDALVLQWRLRLGEHFTLEQLNQIEVFTASGILVNDIRLKVDTIIVDELHLFLGEEFIKTINGTHVKSTFKLGLTATYEDPKGRHTAYSSIFPIIDTIDETEAIERGFVSSYLEYNLSIQFTDEERILYEKYTHIIKNTINKFGKSSLDLAKKCLGGGIYKGEKRDNKFFVYSWAYKNGWRKNLDMSLAQNQEINEIWNPHKIFGYAVHLMNAVRLRKELLYNCDSKAYVTVDIIEKFLGEKAIVFGQKTAYADKVKLLLNEKYPNYCVAYHSNLSTEIRTNPKTGKPMKFGKVRLKKEAINFIKKGIAKCITTASSLDTGLDVPDILIGIIGSGTQNFNQQQQRGGRVKRKLADVLAKDKVKLIINLYVKDTQDEVWLKKRQSKSKNTMYWIETIDEIVYNPINKKEFKISDI